MKEIKQQAHKSWENNTTVSGASMPNKIYESGYIAGAEPREKRIAELEKQIEKMKQSLIDIKANTDDVNIEWQIKYLFDELGIKENK